MCRDGTHQASEGQEDGAGWIHHVGKRTVHSSTRQVVGLFTFSSEDTPMTDSRSLAAVGVLLGGSSRRMGQSKHDMVLPDGTTLLDRMVSIAEELCTTVVLCGDGAAKHTCPRVEDHPDSNGPLAGVEALLQRVEQGRCLILPCDMPGLRLDDLHRLAASHADLAIFAAAGTGKMRSLPLLIDASMLPDVKRAIAEHSCAMWTFIQSHPHEQVAPPEDGRTLVNLNTPEELQAWITAEHERSSR